MTAPDREAHTKSPLLRRDRLHKTLGTRLGGPLSTQTHKGRQWRSPAGQPPTVEMAPDRSAISSSSPEGPETNLEQSIFAGDSDGEKCRVLKSRANRLRSVEIEPSALPGFGRLTSQTGS